jgi:hypothetical protein
VTKFWKLNFDTLLAQYLYKNKKLNLPGIGTFEAPSSVSLPDENDKQKPSLEGITYRNVRVIQPDDDLIDFIKLHTGKMKPLALSDLEDYLALGKQFLNIGKPFYIEGIGTLKLTKDGKYEFAPGAYVSTRLEEPTQERSENRMTTGYREERAADEASSINIKRILVFIGILGTLALIGWAGYYLYSINTTNQPNILPEGNETVNSTGTDTAVNTGSADSIQASAAADSMARTSGQYKFVVERTTKNRALRRYEDLRSFGSKIMMETPDSITFKLYYIIPATVNDTLRIRDSLNRWYYGNTKKIRVNVEQ